MRIAIDGRTIGDYFPGIGRYTFHLVRALGEIGGDHEYVVYINPRAQNTRYQLTDLRAPRVHLVELPVDFFTLTEHIRIPHQLRRDRIDVFHAPYYVKPCWLPCRSVVTIHDAVGSREPTALPSRQARLAYRVAMWLALATADAVIVPSKAARADLERYFRYPAARTTVIYEAADAFLGPPSSPPPAAVGRVIAATGGRYVLFVGANKPHKNLVGLVAALQAVDPSIHLVVAGRVDPRYPHPATLARALGLADRVLALGEVDDATLHGLLHGALALVLPSHWEGFGLPVLEAMTAGTAVICSDRGSLPEIAGDAALFVDPGSPEALARAINRVAMDATLRQDLITRGRARAKQFSWERTALATISVYEAVGRRQ